MNGLLLQTAIGNIEYQSIGKGIPVLFLHGGHSNCQETLSHKGFDLEKYQLITPSRPGYGKTPLQSLQSLKDTTDLLVELLNHLSITKVVVYGISAGGLTAIKFASNHTERTSKLILASAVSKKWLDKSDPTYKLGKIMFRPGLEGFVWSMVNFFSSLWPRLIANNFYPQFSLLDKHKLRKEDILELTASLKNYRSKAGFVHDLDQNIDEEALKQIRCPSLIIHSKNDASVPLDHALHAHESIPQSKLEVLDNEWGHLFWIGKDSNTAIAQTLSFIEEEV